MLLIGGSSTVFPILQSAIRAYKQEEAGRRVRIQLRQTGTTDGFREFCRGRLAIANASRPINGRELKACANAGVRFIELPIAFDALTVAVNPRNTWARSITLQELSRLWGPKAEGRVKRWNQVNPAWPNRPIRLCGPGSDHGSYDYFNKAVNGSADQTRRDYAVSDDYSGVVRCVAGDADALGYFGFGFVAANPGRVRPLAVTGLRGTVMPSRDSVQRERYLPFARPLFLYVNDKDLIDQAPVRQFVTFFLRRGMDFADQAGFIPLPPATYQLSESKLYRRVPGTSFGGDLPVGLTIGEALRRSFDSVTRRPGY